MHEPHDAESGHRPMVEVNVYRRGHLYERQMCTSWEEAAEFVEAWTGYEGTECEVIGPPIAPAAAAATATATADPRRAGDGHPRAGG